MLTVSFYLQFTSSKLSSSGVLSHYQGGKRGYEDSTKPHENNRLTRILFFFFFHQGSSPELPAFEAPPQPQHKVHINPNQVESSHKWAMIKSRGKKKDWSLTLLQSDQDRRC